VLAENMLRKMRALIVQLETVDILLGPPKSEIFNRSFVKPEGFRHVGNPDTSVLMERASPLESADGSSPEGRLLEAAVTLEDTQKRWGVAPAEAPHCEADELDSFLDAWHGRFQVWWLASPHAGALNACRGALAIHLAERLQRSYSASRLDAPPLTPQTDEVSKGCEWVSEKAETLHLPDFPDFSEFKLPPMVPLPRLLPGWLDDGTLQLSYTEPIQSLRTWTAAERNALLVGVGVGGALITLATLMMCSSSKHIGRMIGRSIA